MGESCRRPIGTEFAEVEPACIYPYGPMLLYGWSLGGADLGERPPPRPPAAQPRWTSSSDHTALLVADGAAHRRLRQLADFALGAGQSL
jgi:hypothetical protein